MLPPISTRVLCERCHYPVEARSGPCPECGHPIEASLKAVGIILVIAMLVAPGAIGLLLTRRFGHMLAVASIAAIGSSVLGTILSFHFDVATGPCIIVLQSLLFAVALAVSLLRSRSARLSGEQSVSTAP